MLKNLRDFDGNSPVFIDATIFLHHAFDINPVSVEFLNRIEISNIKAFTSALVLEEVSYKIMMQSASNYLERVTVQHVKKLLENPKNRGKVLSPLIGYMDYIDRLQEAGMNIIDLKGADLKQAAHHAKESGLITADAAHLSVMFRKSIRHIATEDSDFAAVPNITVWSPSAK
ncbi:MAG: type II toxin-antitoxin system VapC family toxin [Nitrospiraceae bacterium]|nr:type II toxin-antitoxin system VapC family toxin [Nitrospiraceae bacterium]